MLDMETTSENNMITIDSKAQKMLDQNWTKLTGLPLLVLMEQAAAAVSSVCLRIIASKSGQRPDIKPAVLVLGGKGNNGGDAWACARQLKAHGINVSCCSAMPADDAYSNAAKQLEALQKLEIPLLQSDSLQSLKRPDVIVDGLLGSGFRAARGMPDYLVNICRIMNDWRRQGSVIVSIDIPSGVDADNGSISTCAIDADCTVTFSACKTGLAAAPGSLRAGRIIIEPLSMPSDWIMNTLAGQKLPRLLTAGMIRDWRPKRPADGHKGTFGKALLICGGSGMAGAAGLAGQAAARSGAGLVYMAVAKDSYEAVLSGFPEGLTRFVDFDSEDCRELKELSADKNVVAIGPGLGLPGWIEPYLTWLLHQMPRLILDADALNEISRKPEIYTDLLTGRIQNQFEWPVLTPHPGEFVRLAPDLASLLAVDRQNAALQLSERFNCIVVLKGASTVVAMPDGRCFINTSGNDGMAKGGSGDCLTGLIAGLAAQGLTMGKAACAGVYLHGLAGDLAAGKLGKTAMLSTDLLAELGNAWRRAGWLPAVKNNLFEEVGTDI
jgi:NAD(P)H-hydrate epimerase